LNAEFSIPAFGEKAPPSPVPEVHPGLTPLSAVSPILL